MLDNSTKVSMIHRQIKSWLNAEFNLGFRNTKMAKMFPRKPRLMSTEEVTPGTQYFHLTRSWKTDAEISQAPREIQRTRLFSLTT